MTRALVSARESALLKLTRCPCCGAGRVSSSGGRAAAVAFACNAVFGLDANAEVMPISVCPSGSYVAARALNQQALKAVREMAGAP
ncbi:hypothetical protein [Shinella pollutisoli]|uniref:Uncharacterized protein n=1 Tax=Shinella pollutisoli TaxID=2250594 RepID=A0ABV7DJI7_9HYPH|nr:hypothetical protein [Shinella pollutisoli]